jgi:hypothetical protein
MAYECSVCTHIKLPAEEVWEWMSDVRNVLSVNMFHDAVLCDEPVRAAGPRIAVPHSMFGTGKQLRVAHVRDYRKYFIGFGETKAKEEPGVDAFPHYQSFELGPLQDDTCVVVNRLRGVFQWPGADRFGERIFNRWTPVILADDNFNIAVAVGAAELDDKPRLKAGLLLWPLMGLGGKVLKANARKRIVMAEKAKTAAKSEARSRRGGGTSATNGARSSESGSPTPQSPSQTPS